MRAIKLEKTAKNDHFQVVSNDGDYLEAFVTRVRDTNPLVPQYWCWMCRRHDCDHCLFIKTRGR